MYNLLNIYDCPNCGKRLSDEVEYIPVQVADDEWDKLPFCNKCNKEVKIRMHVDPDTKQEIFHYESVDDERAKWAHGFYDETENEDDEYYEYTCPFCCGTIAEDYSTCFCDDEEDNISPQAQKFTNGNDDLPF